MSFWMTCWPKDKQVSMCKSAAFLTSIGVNQNKDLPSCLPLVKRWLPIHIDIAHRMHSHDASSGIGAAVQYSELDDLARLAFIQNGKLTEA